MRCERSTPLKPGVWQCCSSRQQSSYATLTCHVDPVSQMRSPGRSSSFFLRPAPMLPPTVATFEGRAVAEKGNAQPRGERLGVGALARDAGREAGISGNVFG